MPLRDRLAEEHPRRLIADAHIDADILPRRLQHLLHEFARAVAGGGAEFEPERLSGGVAAGRARRITGPPRLVQQPPGRVRVEGRLRQVRVIDPVERADRPVRHRLAAEKEALRNRLPVDGVQQRAPHPDIGQRRIVEVEVDMLVDQPRLVGEIPGAALALLHGGGLVEAEAEFAGDVVDGAGAQIDLERRRVLDDADDDRLEGRRFAPPGRVALQLDGGARLHADHPVRPEPEAGIGAVGVEGGPVPVFGRVRVEIGAVDMGGKHKDADIVVVEGHPVQMQGEPAVVMDFQFQDAPEEFRRGDARLRVLADLDGEGHVPRRHRRAVAPARIRADGVGDRDALLALRRRLAHRPAVLDGRKLDTEHADEPPLRVVNGKGTHAHRERIALRQHRIDQRMQGRGELGHADDQPVLRPGGQRGGEGQQDRNGESPDHDAKLPGRQRMTLPVRPERRKPA